MKNIFLIILFSLSYGEWVSSYTPKIISYPYTDSLIRFLWISDQHYTENANDVFHVAFLKLTDTCRRYLPNFLLNTGDITSNGPNGIINTLIDNRNLLRSVIYAPGNHDENIDTAAGDPYYPDTDHSKYIPWHGQDAPYYKSTRVYSGDSSFKLLVFSLDLNFYDSSGTVLPEKSNCERVGLLGANDGIVHRYCQPQISWFDSILKSDTISDAVLISTHFVAPYIDPIIDSLAVDGRPAIILRGHGHTPRAIELVYNTLHTKNYRLLMCPAFMGDGTVFGGFAKMVMHLESDSIAIDSAVMLNYEKPPAFDTLYYPFTDE